MKAAKEALPNPGDMFQSLRYIQDQAARGRFEGHTTAYLVLTFLVTNMWVKVPNPDGAGIGEVMYGRSAIDTIAGCTVLSRRSVQRALDWLAEAEWIDSGRSHDDSGREDRRQLIVRLDMAAHRLRERMLVEGGREGVIKSPTRVSECHPGRVSESHPTEGVRESPLYKEVQR